MRARRHSLLRALKTAGAAWDLAVQKRRYQWEVAPPNTFFLHAEHADIRLRPHDQPLILASIELRGGFGWALESQQDEAGVYIIARRKPLVGKVARGKFDIQLPRGLHISLRLTDCQLRLDELDADIDLAPDLYGE